MAHATIAQKRLSLLNLITKAMGDHQDLGSMFTAVVRSVEEQLPVELACLCLFDREEGTLTVESVATENQTLAQDLTQPERARIDIEENGWSRCLGGDVIYEADLVETRFPFSRRVANGGLRSFVAAPLQVGTQVLGVLIAARQESHGFSADERAFLKQLSQHVALAAHHAQLYADLQSTHMAIMQQERLRALGQMASGIAHDINNALSPITLYTESLLETDASLSTRARTLLEIIQRAVGDISHAVTRLGDFSRPNAVGAPHRPIDLNTLIPQVLALTHARWSDMAQQRGVVIEIRTDLTAETPPIVGVESEIRETLINLIFNAVDAMPAGGCLTISTELSTDALGRQVLLKVEDTGVGMNDETKQRCMEPFFTTKGDRGSGLGLAMVYGVAHRHSAGVDIASVLGKGTVMKLSFPISQSTPAVGIPIDESLPLAPLRLLLVDDDAQLRKSLGDILEADGHTVVVAEDGPLGVAAFSAALSEGEPFQAVITDLGMPHMSGLAVAGALKRAAPSTPVILLTGWGQNYPGAPPADVDCVLSKPPTLGALRAALTACHRASKASRIAAAAQSARG